MNKYLIFRTDRIGDFIFSRMLTQAIKKKNSKNIIDIVCSKYNHDYIKKYKDIRYTLSF
jgi:ADP-heptose:LPS heptosyltransferase